MIDFYGYWVQNSGLPDITMTMNLDDFCGEYGFTEVFDEEGNLVLNKQDFFNLQLAVYIKDAINGQREKRRKEEAPPIEKCVMSVSEML